MMSVAAMMTIGLFILVVILLIWQPINPILVGAGIPLALTLLGIVKPAIAFNQFANTTVIFFMCLLVVGGAIFRTGLADFLGEKIIGLVGKTERGVLMGTALVCCSLSAFLNDTGTTGCLIPIVGAVAKRSKVAISKCYLVLAYFASIGGTITLIGGGGHIVVQGFLEEAGYPGFTFFEFVRIGLPFAIVSFIWLYFFGTKNLPVREIKESEIPATAERQPKKMLLVAAVFIFIVFCMATKLLAMHVAAALGAFLVVITGCISVNDAIKSFSMSTMFLVGGIFSLSAAMASTGAAKFLIGYMSTYLAGMHPLIVIFGISLVALVATNFMMGTALCAILTPMALMVGKACNLDPHALAMAVAICTSGAFCTPFGTGPNLLVYEIGGLQFKDYTKSGVAYEIFMLAICTIGVYVCYI